jgi:hypothetical protein
MPWKGNFINFSMKLYLDICSIVDRGKSMKMRQQGDDENKKEEMVVTTMRRAFDTWRCWRSLGAFDRW